jgi:hypothetical protein
MGILVGTDSTTTGIAVYTLYPNNTVPSTRLTDAWVPSAAVVGHFYAGYSSVVFLALSALNHLVCATNMFGWKTYVKNSCIRAASPIRWLEYSVSASLMHVQIAVLCGVLDVHLLLTIGALTAVTMLFALVHEQRTGASRDAPWYRLGFIPWIAQWIVMMSYFMHNVRDANAPDWVYAIIFIELGLDSSFAAAMEWQELQLTATRRRRECACTRCNFSFIGFDAMFVILSLTAKQLLAWINYWGARH